MRVCRIGYSTTTSKSAEAGTYQSQSCLFRISVLPATTVFREWLRIGPAGHRLDWSGPHLSIVEECRTPERIPGSADAYARAEARIQIQAEPDSSGPECVPEAFALCGVVRLVSGSR